MRKKGVLTVGFLCIGLFMGCFLAGCGGRSHDTAGRKRAGAVTGAGVSGQAVSADAISVSGQAVSEGEAGKDSPFCNSTNLYYCTWGVEMGSKMWERSLTDGTEREISFSDGEVAKVCWADDQWVYYLRWHESGEEEESIFITQLHRSPVRNGRIDVEGEEVVLYDKEDIITHNCYCDGHVFIYQTEEDWVYKKYDIDRQEYLDERPAGVDFQAVSAGGTMFLDFDDFDEENGYGFVRQDPGRKELEQITECPGVASFSDADVFYTEYADVLSEDDKNGAGIERYRIADRSSEEVINGKQIWELLTREGYLEASAGRDLQGVVTGLYQQAGNLYIQIGISWWEKEVRFQNMVVLRYDLASGGELRIDRGLTACLENPAKYRRKFTKNYAQRLWYDSVFYSRGRILDMNGDKCYMCLYHREKDKNMLASYDLQSGELKFLTEKDPEWYEPYRYRHTDVNNYYGEAWLGDDMPNDKGQNIPDCYD